MNTFRNSLWTTALLGAVVLSSCSNDDPPLPDNTVQFQSSSQGLTATQSDLTVTIMLDRAVEAAGNVTLSYVASGLTYGNDFITDPVVDANNKIVVPVAAGATSTTFKITKTNTTGLEGNEKVDFTIESLPDGLVIGAQKTFTLSFSEIIATAAEMQINGGGTNAQNRVFIDLSGNSQTAVARTTWDFAFASAADQFRVVLNSSNKMLAYKLDKNDLSEVVADDTLNLGKRFSTDAIFGVIGSLKETDPIPDWIAGTTAWMDDRSGDLTKTAIAEVNADEDENLVYIINRGTDPDGAQRGWLKIRVIRDGSDYKLEYAALGDANIKTATIVKDAATNFTYFSVTTNSIVTVEPPKGDWDIAWTGFTNVTSFGGPLFPYYNQDIILTNIYGGAQAFAYTTGEPGVSGVTGAKTYDTFTSADLSIITNYASSQLGIGSTWRILGQDGASLSTNRFYIIKDAAGNIYKLQFTALTSNNERGKPQFKFELLTKGS